MNLLGPNLLLAVTTAFATGFAVLSASVYGGPDGLVRNLLLAGVCAVGYVLLNPLMGKLIKRPPGPPLIYAQARSSVVWALSIPAIILLMAAIPAVRPGYDYGLIVIIAAVLWGLTLESAVKARKGGTSGV